MGKKREKNPFANPRFDAFQMPDAGILVEDKIRVAKNVGKEADLNYIQGMEKLRAEIIRTNPIHLLCSASFGSSVIDATAGSEWAQSEPFTQAHLELIQSVALKYDWETYKHERPNLDSIISLARNVSTYFMQRRLKDLDSNLSESERRLMALREDVRAHTQVVRNWGYAQHVLKIVHNLVSPLDTAFQTQHGVKATSCVDLIFRLIKLIEDRFNDWVLAQRHFFRTNTKEAAYEQYKQLFPSDPWLIELEALVNDSRISLKAFKVCLLTYSDVLVQLIYTFTVSEIQNLFEEYIDPVAIKKILSTWSLPFGGTKTYADDRLFLGSPVRTRPFIALPEDIYLLPIPGLLQSSCLQLIEQLFFSTEQLKNQYHERRYTFLEEELCNLLKQSFPHGEVFGGSKWPEDSSVYENDALLILDSFALVCEAKSARVADSARRGGDRLKNNIEELIVNPAEQAANFAKYLSENPGIHNFKTKSGAINRVDSTRVSHILTLSVTLDDIRLRWDWDDLKESGIVQHDTPKVPCLMLADLLIIFDILDNEAQRIHYLYRRSQLDSNLSFIGDEIDLLALYLKTRLFIKVDPGTVFHGIGESTVFEEYYLNSFAGIKTKKPTMPLTNRWNNAVRWLEKSNIVGWTKLALIFLNVPIREQQKIESKLLKITKNLKNRLSTADYLVYKNLSVEPPEVFIFLLRTKYNSRSLKDIIANLIQSNCINNNRVVGIIVNSIDLKMEYYIVGCANIFENTKTLVCIPS